MSKGKWLVVLGIVALMALMMVAVSSAQVGNARGGATVGPVQGGC